MNKSEILTIADTLAKSIGKPESATLTITDTLSKAIGKIETETMALADTLVKDFGLAKADTLTITDALAKDFDMSIVMTGDYARPGIPIATFLFQRAINAILYNRDITLISRREQ